MHFDPRLARLELDRDYGINPLITACLICGEHRAPINLMHPYDDAICRPCNADQIAYLRTMINPAALHARLDAIFVIA
jgi:recombinational DNA repair protein (RecF pathway)